LIACILRTTSASTRCIHSVAHCPDLTPNCAGVASSPTTSGSGMGAPGTRLTSATFAPGPGSPLPHLRRDWAHLCHICAGTGRSPATSGSGLCAARATFMHVSVCADGILFNCFVLDKGTVASAGTNEACLRPGPATFGRPRVVAPTCRGVTAQCVTLALRLELTLALI
jgi:hypothetical protein